MRLFFLTLLLIYSCGFTFAEPIYSEIPEDIASEKYAAIIAKYYERETSSPLFDSSAEYAATLPLRTKILDYALENNLHENGALAEIKWQEYLSKNYKSPEEFKLKVQNAYFTEEYVKDKFKKNLDIANYFNKVILPKVQKDLEFRKQILNLARERQVGFTKTEIKEKYYQAVENLGGEVAFETFLRNNNLTVKEFLFFIESDLLKDKFTKLKVENLLKEDLQLQQIVSMNDPVEFLYREKITSPDFYFRIAYINKNQYNAMGKIHDAHRYFSNIKQIRHCDDIDRDLEVIEMFQPYNEFANIYSEKISKQLQSMIDAEYHIKLPISPVLSTENGYFIIDLYKVEKPNVPATYQKLLENKRKLLEREIKGDYQMLY